MAEVIQLFMQIQLCGGMRVLTPDGFRTTRAGSYRIPRVIPRHLRDLLPLAASFCPNEPVVYQALCQQEAFV